MSHCIPEWINRPPAVKRLDPVTLLGRRNGESKGGRAGKSSQMEKRLLSCAIGRARIQACKLKISRMSGMGPNCFDTSLEKKTQ